MPDTTSLLSATDLNVSYASTPAVSDVTLELRRGEILALCGPNGCGKSSALKAIRGLVPHGGDISVLGAPTRNMTARDFARKVAMLGQSPRAPEEMVVRDLVALGRFAHRSTLAGLSLKDQEAIAAALHATDLDALAERTLGALSGGQ
ncbi:MAG: ABC transporter ATP-binding protein, partial [Pseudomonadota bacterium]